jgi:hypothetical protein
MRMPDPSRTHRASTAILIALLLLAPGGAGAGKAQRFAPHVYLTWRDADTSTTMTVNYHTGDGFEVSQVYFDTEARHGNAAAYRFRQVGDATRIPGARKRVVHTVHLTGLTPGAAYHFIAGDPLTGFTEERAFRTIPDDGRPIRFAVGGDMSNYRAAWAMARRVAAEAPDVVMIGGDIAYAGGSYLLWDKWLRRWGKLMVAPDGRTIPLVLAIGDHELGGSPYFQRLFDQGGETFFVRTFGLDIVCVVLDTGNVVPYDGRQSRWLRETLEAHASYPVKLALYHDPLYPAHKSFDQQASVAGRAHWLPLFDRFGLTAGFEHDDHLYKRTKLLTGGRVSPDGTLYIGGGSWGMPPRPPRAEPYLARAEQTRNVVIVDVRADEIEYRAIGTRGETFDRFVQTLDRSVAGGS